MPHSYLAAQRELVAEGCAVLQGMLLRIVEIERQAGRQGAEVPYVVIGNLYHFLYAGVRPSNTTAGQVYGFMGIHPMSRTDVSIRRKS